MVEVRHLFTFGLQCLWAAFLLILEERENGMALSDFMAWVEAELGAAAYTQEVNAFLDDLCHAVKLTGPWRDTHAAFDHARQYLWNCRLQTHRSGTSQRHGRLDYLWVRLHPTRRYSAPPAPQIRLRSQRPTKSQQTILEQAELIAKHWAVALISLYVKDRGWLPRLQRGWKFFREIKKQIKRQKQN